MRFLFDVVHPAHVHFYRHAIAELEAQGHATTVVAREKDVTTDLLDRFGIPYVSVGRAGRGGLVALGAELVRRDWALWRMARRFRADVVLTRNPSGVQAARLAGARGVFDTDDGRQVGVHFRAAAPFAHAITTPDCIPDDFGRKHAKYASYKALAFLHPDRFTPDPGVRDLLGVGGERYFLVRFVALAASHDRSAVGLAGGTQREVVERLQRRGRVFVSSEAALPPDLAHLAFPLPSDRMHDALAFAHLCVTDGQSMAGEAAVLGVPSVRSSSSAGRLDVFRDLGERYGLVDEFPPGADEEFLARVDELAAADDTDGWQRKRERLLEDKCDLTTWLVDFVTKTPSRSPA